MNQQIAITCSGSGWANINDLLSFQDELKLLPAKLYTKLKNSILRYGFSAPIFVWKNMNKILDGHQRVLTIKKMLSEGFNLDNNKLPIVDIEAKDEKEAKKKVLLFVSQYGQTTEQRLYDYLGLNELEFSDMKDEIEIPNIDMERFELEYIEEPHFYPESIDEQGRLDERTPNIACPRCGYAFAA
jgi:hypothetical protein